jgi:hypothetical protein
MALVELEISHCLDTNALLGNEIVGGLFSNTMMLAILKIVEYEMMLAILKIVEYEMMGCLFSNTMGMNTMMLVILKIVEYEMMG